VNVKSHVVNNFNSLIENDGLLKVTGSYTRCKCGNISKTGQDSYVVTTDH